MGTIAHRASQFFESLGRKASIKKRSTSTDQLETGSDRAQKAEYLDQTAEAYRYRFPHSLLILYDKKG